MNRIDELFNRKKREVLSIYLTAGFPQLDDTMDLLVTLQESGVDLVELGMPFSDPLADGEVIQRSSQKALNNGMSISRLFEQIEGLRRKVNIPVIMMGYLNPVMQYGFERFVSRCADIGIDGLIIPDLPLDIFKKNYQVTVEKYGLKFTMLITPQTSPERIRSIAEASGGFLYMVADSSTTGAKSGISDKQIDYFNRVADMNIAIPRMIGFGISSKSTFERACKYSNGAIIGSAFIKALEIDDGKDTRAKARDFVNDILAK